MPDNLNPTEIEKFAQISEQWWDKNGPCKPLHELNPHRLRFIELHTTLIQKQVLDIGCGGGILSESLAKRGADTTAIDLNQKAIDIAKTHAESQQLNIHYQCIATDQFAKENPQRFDIITCMELLEHVPNPEKIIENCTQLLADGGHLFVSTLNRTLFSYLSAIVGAEYLLKMLPIGTHDYQVFIKPCELALWGRNHQLELKNSTGIVYNPLLKKFSLNKKLHSNYILHFQKN